MSEVLYLSCAKGLEYLVDQTIKHQGVDGGSSLVCRKPSVVVLATHLDPFNRDLARARHCALIERTQDDRGLKRRRSQIRYGCVLQGYQDQTWS